MYRATEYSPPLFHQAPPLPAVIGGVWLSIRCESVDGGFWSKRFFQIHSDDSRWFARWTYYVDSTCSNSLYSINAAGNYVQRVVRQRRDIEDSNIKTSNIEDLEKPRENLVLNIHRRLFNGTEELYSLKLKQRQKMKINQEQETIVGNFKVQKDKLPFGTSELELKILEYSLIPVDKIIPTNCKGTTKEIKHIRNEAGLWTKNCILGTNFKTPAILKFKAKIGLDWKGDYTLLLASWEDDLWEAPLHQCSEITSRNYFREFWPLLFFRRDNRYDRFSRYRQDWFSSSFATSLTGSSFMHSIVLFLYWLHLFSYIGY